MVIVPQSVTKLAMTENAIQLIEAAGRTCYKSKDSITLDSAEKFVRMIIKRGHDSVLEHASMTVRIITDRGITHEIVRHRIGMSYSQESTRYVNYKKSNMEFIQPDLCSLLFDRWQDQMKHVEKTYKELVINGTAPQHARSILPNCLKTEIVVTGNFRAWRHFIRLRASEAAHPQIRWIANEIKGLLPPVIVEDL